MSLRISTGLAALALLVCLICPIVELFDQWDHTVQTGNDTEYAIVIVGLCIGAAYAIARFVATPPGVESVSDASPRSCTFANSPDRGHRLTFSVPLSPPGLALRI